MLFDKHVMGERGGMELFDKHVVRHVGGQA